VFVTHGEPAAADTLRRRIEHELGWPAHAPEAGEQVDLCAIPNDVERHAISPKVASRDSNASTTMEAELE
jgi:hypothetical protein